MKNVRGYISASAAVIASTLAVPWALGLFFQYVDFVRSVLK